ncbi:NERD domain-containing protein [Pseudomonas putida]|uniref:NERD domain-containing protein n=1 Tax=Pseudomonas putida TaxID=303 RepID=UPI00381DB1CE
MPLFKDRKSIDHWIAKLHKEVKSGNLSAATELLSSGLTPLQVTKIREQKIILAAPPTAQASVVEILRAASKKLDTNDIKKLNNYLDFFLAFVSEQRKAINLAREKIKRIPKMSKAELLLIGEETFEWHSLKITTGANLFSANISVAEREHQLHEINGTLVDLAYAVTRSINECSRLILTATKKRLSNKQHHRALKIFRNMIKEMSEINSLEWFFDSVSYGSFDVIEHQKLPSKKFCLEFTDPRLSLTQRLSIRRTLSHKQNMQPAERFIRLKLKESQHHILKHAFEYYTHSSSHTPNLSHLETEINSTLAHIDAEDDLLLLASNTDAKVSAYYIAAFNLQCYAKVAKITDPRNSTPIPFEEISKTVVGSEGRALITSALESLTIDLPARSHFSILNKPFIREAPNSAYPFLGGDFGTWTAAVRETLTKGGPLGKEFGKMWELFYEHCFKASNWKIIGKGINIRKNGKTLTEIDLLIVKDNLLLVIEIKSLSSSGNTAYEHWKNKQTIQLGCSQAYLAAEHIKANKDTLLSLCGKRIANHISHIQPVVLTTADHFEGWSFNGVPVIGEVTRKAICTGAKVDYYTSKESEPVHTHYFTKPEDLGTEKILHILKGSIELEASALTEDIQYTSIKVGDIVFVTPEFAKRTRPHPFEPHVSKAIQEN